jgi:hypothetical protein
MTLSQRVSLTAFPRMMVKEAWSWRIVPAPGPAAPVFFHERPPAGVFRWSAGATVLRSATLLGLLGLPLYVEHT